MSLLRRTKADLNPTYPGGLNVFHTADDIRADIQNYINQYNTWCQTWAQIQSYIKTCTDTANSISSFANSL